MVSEPGAGQLLAWVDGYERAWRSADSELLAGLFTDDAEYLVTPYDEPAVGLEAIRGLWDDKRTGPDEVFTMRAEVVACSGDTGVARVLVRYGDPVTQEYTDPWVVRFADDGRVSRFEEWPFWPTHGRSPVRSPPVVLSRGQLPVQRWTEWVRTETLSSGVYRVAAGGIDDQEPHAQDEVYVVLSGAADLEVEGRRTPVATGSVAFVARRAAHRFVAVTEDLEVAVVFAPPEG